MRLGRGRVSLVIVEGVVKAGSYAGEGLGRVSYLLPLRTVAALRRGLTWRAPRYNGLTALPNRIMSGI